MRTRHWITSPYYAYDRLHFFDARGSVWNKTTARNHALVLEEYLSQFDIKQRARQVSNVLLILCH